MALTGTLLADFTQFQAAVTQAETHLKSFETGASKVEGSLNRMVDAFSGRKILSEATIATEAVARLGGASTLTEAEQRKVNATLTEALAKYAALGQTAPPAMVALAAATKQTEVATAGLSTHMVALGTFIGTMAANAVTALARMAADGLKAVASGIVDLVMQGPKISGIENSFQTLAASVNASGAAMLGSMREGTRGLVTDLDLMTVANKAVLLGLPVTVKEMGDLSQTATVLGKAMGLGPTQAFDNLITALGRSSPLILDNLGLTVKVGEANEIYATKLGKSAEQLTEAETKQAFYNAAMVAARDKVEALGQQQDSLGDAIARGGIWWNNFKDNLAVAIARSPVLAAGMDTLGASFSKAFGSDTSALVQTLSGYVSQFAITAVDAAVVTIDAMRLVVTSFLSVRAAVFELATTYTVKVREMIDETLAVVAAGRLFTQFMTPFGGDLSGFDAVILKLGEIRKQLGGVGGSFVDTANDALIATGKWNTGLDSAQKSLSTARAAMVAAMTVTASLTVATAAHGVVHENVAKVIKRSAEEQAKDLQTTSKLWNEYYALVAANSGTATDKQIADIERWKKDQSDLWIKAHTDAKGFFDATTTESVAFFAGLEANAGVKLAAVGSHWAELSGKSREALIQQRDQALADYERMTSSSLTFSRGALAEALTKYRELRDAARHYGDSSVDASNRAAKAEEERRKQQEIQEAAKKKADEDELMRLNRMQGGSFNITRENFAATARGLGQDAGLVERFLHMGYSFEQAMLWARHPEWPPPEHPGPRVPGFARGASNFGGGWAMVGEEGPELLNLPKGSTVLPHGRVPGFAGGTGGAGLSSFEQQLLADQRALEEFLKRMLPDKVAMDRQQALVDLLTAQVAADKANPLVAQSAGAIRNQQALDDAIKAMTVTADVEKYRAEMAAQMGLLAAKVEYDKAQIQAKVDLASLNVVSVAAAQTDLAIARSVLGESFTALADINRGLGTNFIDLSAAVAAAVKGLAAIGYSSTVIKTYLESLGVAPGRIPHFSGGVENFAGGMAMVGERGPELVNLPGGSSVIPFGRGGGTTINNIVIHAGAVGSEQQLARMVQKAMVDLARAQGKRLGN